MYLRGHFHSVNMVSTGVMVSIARSYAAYSVESRIQRSTHLRCHQQKGQERYVTGHEHRKLRDKPKGLIWPSRNMICIGTKMRDRAIHSLHDLGLSNNWINIG